MLRYEYQQKLLIRHRHLNIHKDLIYFREKPEVPNDLIEMAQQLTIPTPPASLTKKESKQTPTASGLHLNLSIGSNPMGMNDSVNICSPSTIFPSTPTSADVVIIGSNITSNIPQNQVLINRLQSMPPTIPMPQQAKGPNKCLTTPDKQRASSAGGSAKKRNTTPRAARGTNIRGASANAAAMAPQIGQPNIMTPMSHLAPGQPQQLQLTPSQQQQAKLASQQGQMTQQQLQHQRSTNSPMLMPGQPQYHMQGPGYNPQAVNRIPSNNMNPMMQNQANQAQLRPVNPINGGNNAFPGQMINQPPSQSILPQNSGAQTPFPAKPISGQRFFFIYIYIFFLLICL